MTTSVTVSVVGLADVLKELGRIDPLLRREGVNRVKGALEPLAGAARTFVPSGPPLSGLARGRRLAWSSGRVRSQINAQVTTKKRSDGMIPLARVIQRNPAGAMWDMAGKAGGNTEAGKRMIAVMQKRTGAPSRSMWRAASQMERVTERALEDAVTDIGRILSQSLGGR